MNKLTHEEYIKRVSAINKEIILIDKYVNTRTLIRHKCLKDGHVWLVRPRDILHGHGCPVCSGRTVGPAPEYKNSIWASSHREYFSLYMSENQMKCYSPQSGQTIEVICPDCGTRKEIKISVLLRQGLGCICGDKISFANKFVFNVLKQIGVSVEMEYTPVWSQGRKYDDYLVDYNLIIENHGRQHYEECSLTQRTLTEEQENDLLKQQIAQCNHISYYIILDCRNSTKEHLMKSIMESELPSILCFSEVDIDWDKASVFAHTNFIRLAANLYNDGKRAKEISEILCVNRSTVCHWLNVATALGLCNYNPQTEHKLAHIKRILCVELNQIFDSLTEAAIHFNTTVHSAFAFQG